ncbi:MAG: energy transducer TonB, partial [Muribaculaceae bacterium]|nr:energy transducer TonB [Muribaculaceae bacterium]
MKNLYNSFNISRSLSLRASRIAVVTAALSVAWIQADAQTCRISMGVNSEGHKAFREVFEYDYVSDKPTFPGGDWKLVEYINHTRQYPREAYEKGIQGRVTCSFVVNTD